ncbi:MAG: hypothetical protein ACW986_15315 [Promethearchaeota archaeon]
MSDPSILNLGFREKGWYLPLRRSKSAAFKDTAKTCTRTSLSLGVGFSISVR